MKYPAIIDNSSNHVVLVYEDFSAIHLEGEFCGEASDRYSIDRLCKDITHEYLSNTWGVVESKEHAEFIIELAELHGFDTILANKSAMSFEFSDGLLNLYDIQSDIFTPNQESKQITIPLPPKEVKAVDEWPKLGGKAVLGGCAVIVNGLHNDLAWCSYMENNECIITTKISNLSKPKSKQDLLIEELQTKLCNNNAVDNYILACDIINGEIEGLSYV